MSILFPYRALFISAAVMFFALPVRAQEERGVESPDSIIEEMSEPDPVAPAPEPASAPPVSQERRPVNRGQVEEVEEAPPKIFDAVMLQGINKITAERQTIKARLGTLMHFGNLEIVALNCWQSAESEKPENAAMLEVWEITPDERPERIFLGWMYSSSPALSSLEHPVYDLSVLTCEGQEGKQ